MRLLGLYSLLPSECSSSASSQRSSLKSPTNGSQEKSAQHEHHRLTSPLTNFTEKDLRNPYIHDKVFGNGFRFLRADYEKIVEIQEGIGKGYGGENGQQEVFL